MFNYSKEVIVNDASKLFNDKGSGTSATMFGVKRGGNYDLAKIVDKRVYFTPGNKGVCGKWDIDFASKFNGGDSYRIEMFIGAGKQAFIDFALPEWQNFGKPIVIETAGTDAATVVKALALALPNDNPLYRVSETGGTITIELVESWMEPKEFSLYTLDKDGVETKKETIKASTDNVEEFATGKWLVENHRLPTYPNLRYERLYADESPIAGKVYDQFTFDYRVEKSAIGGLSGVGQVVDAITHHEFYVLDEIKDDFIKLFNLSVTPAENEENGFKYYEVVSNEN